MTTGKELTTISELGGGQIGIFNPEAQIEMAIKASKALAKVIAQKKKPVIINGEQYLEFEDWQTLGQFDGVSVKTGDAEPVEIDGVKGAKAKAYLINTRTGEIVGGAEAYCMRDEEKWGTRPKYEYQDNKRIKVADEPVPWFQLASMAQTRAGSKALRNKEAWIAVLAGYKPTPAEEMTGNETRGQSLTVEHWCTEHNTAFFMRGKMKSFAHPIGNTSEWCHEKKAGATSDQDKEPTPETSPDATMTAQEDQGKASPAPEVSQQGQTTSDQDFDKLKGEPTPAKSETPATKTKRDPATIKSITDLMRACHADFGLQPAGVLKELNVTTQSAITDTPASCYLKVSAVYEQKDK